MGTINQASFTKLGFVPPEGDMMTLLRVELVKMMLMERCLQAAVGVRLKWATYRVFNN